MADNAGEVLRFLLDVIEQRKKVVFFHSESSEFISQLVGTIVKKISSLMNLHDCDVDAGFTECLLIE